MHERPNTTLDCTNRDSAFDEALQRVMEQWTPIVAPRLHDLARATWGKDSYVFIPHVSLRACSWTVASQRGGDVMNYQVMLHLTLVTPHRSDDVSAAPVVQPVSFTVSGLRDFRVAPTEEALADALRQVQRVGPKGWGLTEAEEQALERMAYRSGEHDPRDWGIVAAYGVDIAIGVALIGGGIANHAWYALPGALLAALGIVGLAVTSAGKRMGRLSAGKKWAARGALLPAFMVIAALTVAIAALVVFVNSGAASKPLNITTSMMGSLFKTHDAKD